ncbi:glycosyltransferase family 2 protein [Ectobacillus ponti]|uniref:Glycosyltransferase n=1 Tax=Ectobacillus ponti TaxID=2961894 RepID=A0AA41X8J1_9BACI|nr:glycosyltransferase [Ectobacillus ponti]MCP8968340.1 glycosyltransferase [Ectobacillus ponti]
MLPKVTIIIPFYNCRYVQSAIWSALAQTHPHVEVIVVDDGSTKYTELIEPYKGRIRYIRKENGGTATALNAGIRAATGEYISWLSSDDMYDPKKVEAQLAFMLEKQAYISCTRWNLIDAEGTIIHYNVGNPIRSRIEFLQTMAKSCVINGCTIMIHKNIFQEIGLFDEALLYTHDYDLWLRVMKKYEMHYLDMTLINYRVHENMGSIQHGKEQQEEVVLVKRKHRQDLQRLIQELAAQQGKGQS